MNYLLNLLLVTALSALAGCHPKAESPPSPSQASGRVVRQEAPLGTRAPDPCALALARHSGDTRLDQDILHTQQQIPKTPNPNPLLDRLGWLLVQKARVSFDPGFYKLAEQCALCLDSKQPGSLDAMLLRGHVLQNLHRFKDAEPLARELVARRGRPFDFGLLGDVLMEQGRLNEAIEAYQRMVDLRPDPRAFARIAHVRWLRGDLHGAIQVMQLAARAASPGDAESGAWMHSRLALYEWQAGDSAKARRSCEAALELQKDYPLALLVRGRLSLAEGKNVEALEQLSRANELNPLPEYQWALTEALRTSGMNEGAAGIEAKLRRSGAVDDPRTYALYLATRGEQASLAVRLAERELRERTDVHSFDALAWALAATGHWEAAWRQSERALAEGTLDARLALHAGVIATKLQRMDDATRLLGQARCFQQMLLPSEREHLQRTEQELAARIDSKAAPYRTAANVR